MFDVLNRFFTARLWRAVALLLVLCGSAHAAGAAPANDLFGRQQVVAGLEGQVAGTTIGATRELDEPRGFLVGESTVWYRWVAPVSGFTRFGADGSSRSLTLEVFTGAGVSDLEEVRDGDGRSIAVTFQAVAGTAYRIQVGTADETPTAFDLSWRQVPAPPNDHFARAQTILGSNGTVQGNLTGASVEAGETGALAKISVWFRYVAPASGPFKVSVFAVGPDVNVYTGTALSNLQQVNQTQVQRGQILYIQVLGFPGENRTYRLTYSGPGVATYSVSGRVTKPAAGGTTNGAFGARVTIGKATTTTDGDGYYNITGLRVGSYTAVATLSGFVLRPTFVNPLRVTTNLSEIDFRATVGTPPPSGTFSIAGRVTDGAGRALSGVTVTRSGDVRAVTNALGVYQFAGLRVGNYTLTPSRSGFEFNPISSTVAVRRANVANINFQGAPTGTASVATTPVAGLSQGEAKAATDQIELKFVSPLDLNSAPGSAYFAVSVGGRSVAVESISYSQSTVVLQLEEGALTNGAAVTVSWNDLRDQKGQTLSGSRELVAQ